MAFSEVHAEKEVNRVRIELRKKEEERGEKRRKGETKTKTKRCCVAVNLYLHVPRLR
jgi:hypothetical protein